MQIHPLFTVKKAAEVLGVEKQFLRTQLETGTIRGEKRRVGERDKWFIYHGEVKDLRDTKRLHQLIEKAKRISTEDLTDFFDDDDLVGDRAGVPVETGKATSGSMPHEASPNLTESFYVEQADIVAAENLVLSNLVDSELPSQVTRYETQSQTQIASETEAPFFAQENEQVIDALTQTHLEPELEHFKDTFSGPTSVTLDTVLQKLTVEFAYRLAEERSRVCELEHLLETKEECLRLLPDLEKQIQAHQTNLAAEQAKFEAEQAIRRIHEQEVVELKEKIRLLEEEKAKPKSWFQRLFG